MLCKNCGATLEENAAVCGVCNQAVEEAPVVEEVPVVETPAAETPVAQTPVVEAPVVEPPVVETPVVEAPAQPANQPKPYQPRRKPHILLRFLLQLLSLAVCLVLCVSVLATTVLADLNHIMSAGGIKELITTILTPVAAPHRNMPVIGALGVYLGEAEAPEGTTVPEIGEDFTIPGDFDIDDLPEDILSGGDSEENISVLIDWIYEEMLGSSEGELTITKEQLETFVEESTVSEFMADKLAGFAEDFLNGTANTTITTEEVLELLNENMATLESCFDVKLTFSQKQLLKSSIEQIMEDKDISNVIREQVFTSVEDAINDSVSDTGMTWEELQPLLQVICADRTLYIAIGVCVFLMLLLCLLNFYNLPGGLSWSAFPCILVGAVMTVPLKMLPTLMQIMGEDIPAVVPMVLNSFASVLLPIHSMVLYIGFGLLVVSIVWRIIRAIVRHKRRVAAAV